MKKVLFIPVTVILALVMCYCGLNIWSICAQYKDEAQIKSDMHRHNPKHDSRQTDDAAARSEPELAARSEPELAEQPQPCVPDAPKGSPYNAEPVSSGSAAAEIVNVETPEMNLPVNPFVITLQIETNADIAGWINIPETNIDYPVVQTTDNDFYLRRNIYKQDATAGSIFMDYRCNKELARYNTIIYGHNMKNRSMFGDLRLFADPGFFEENQYGTLYTACGTHTIRFFAYMVVPSDDEQVYSNPSSPEDYHDYIKDKARNYREPANRDKVVTLSTCSKEFENARGVLIAYVCE